MKSKSLLMFIVAAILILSCATVGPKSAPQRNSSQTVVEEKWVSRIPCYLEDIYDYDEVFFITQPVVKQTLASGNLYYLEDIYDYDEAFFTNEAVINATADCKNLLDYFAVLSIVDETPVSTIEPTAEQTLASGNQYYLGDIYDYHK
jgi:hypothetical protein